MRRQRVIVLNGETCGQERNLIASGIKQLGLAKWVNNHHTERFVKLLDVIALDQDFQVQILLPRHKGHCAPRRYHRRVHKVAGVHARTQVELVAQAHSAFDVARTGQMNGVGAESPVGTLSLACASGFNTRDRHTSWHDQANRSRSNDVHVQRDAVVHGVVTRSACLGEAHQRVADRAALDNALHPDDVGQQADRFSAVVNDRVGVPGAAGRNVCNPAIGNRQGGGQTAQAREFCSGTGGGQIVGRGHSLQRGLNSRLAGKVPRQIRAGIARELVKDLHAQRLAQGQGGVCSCPRIDQGLDVCRTDIHEVGKFSRHLLVTDSLQAGRGDGIDLSLCSAWIQIFLGGNAERLVSCQVDANQ